MLAHLINVREAAARLGVHENTIRRGGGEGLLHAVRLPSSRYRRFDAGEIDRMVHEMRSQLASADEGYVIEPATPIKGDAVMHGDLDATDEE
jgi:DNA-binding transcriptional MerR regulator